LLGLALACDPVGVLDDEDTAPGSDTDTDTDTDTGGDSDTEPFEPPEYCEEALQGELQHVASHPEAPYFVHHPDTDSLSVPTIVFMPGGGGTESSGPGTFRQWFERGSSLGDYRVLVVVSGDGDLTDEWDRVPAALDEVLACYGGDSSRVHLAGTSNGGLGAFSVMLDHYERFATLMGCPGVWTSWDEDEVLTALTGRPVYNGVGELDSGWLPYVELTHERLLALGLDSVYVEFEGQDHIPNDAFDQDQLFDFWDEH